MLLNNGFTAESLLELSWRQTWQVAAVAVLVAIVTVVFCRRRPHLAYLLWLLVLVKAVTPPIWSSPTGAFSWTLAERVQLVSPDPPPFAPSDPSLPAIEFTESTRPAQVPADPAPSLVHSPVAGALPPSGLALHDALLIAWATGVIGLGMWLTVNWLLLARRIRRTTESPDRALADRFAGVKRRIRVHRPVRLRISQDQLGPAALGWWRGTVLVPQSLIEQSSPAELDAIFAHELVHLRRFDPLVGTLQLAVQCLWWWHPAIWWANRQVRIERERSCDEAVLAQLDVSPAAYARLLVELLATRRPTGPAVFWSGMRSTSATTARVRHVLETKSFRRRVPLTAWLLAALALAIVLPGAGSRFITAAPPQKTATNPEASPKVNKTVASEDGAESKAFKDEKPAAADDRHERQDAINRLSKLGLRLSPFEMNGQTKLYAAFDKNFEPLAEPLPLADLPNIEQIAIGEMRDLSDEQLVARLQAVRNLRPETNLIIFFRPDQGAAFDALAEIPNLERLCLLSELPPVGGKTGRKITLPELKGLRELSLLGNFTDAGLKELAPLDQLEELQLYQEKPFARLDLVCLENKPRLRRFITGGIEPTDEAFTHIGNLRALEQLATSCTAATDQGMLQLGKLENLKTLTLDSSREPSRITLKGMRAIGKLTNLVNLTVDGKFSTENAADQDTADDQLVAGWSTQLKQLKVLSLFNCRLSNAGLSELSKLPALVRLHLSGELHVTDEGMTHVGEMTSLVYLLLSNAAITDDGLARLKPLTGLESLVLYNSPQITDDGLAPLAGFNKLDKLVITNAKIEGRGLAPFTTLTSLSLENNPVDDAGVEVLVRNEQITDLNLSGTKITDKAFELIAENLPDLQRLNVRQTQLTDAGLEELQTLRQLREVRAAGTQITKAGKDSLKSVVDFGSKFVVDGEIEIFGYEVE